MKNLFRFGAAAFLLTLVIGISTTYASKNDVINNDKSATGYLFAISSTEGKVEGDTLTLSNVPGVVYFTDRPNRKSGQMMVSDFLSGWSANSDDLKNNPPNAVLSIMGEKGNQNIVVVLANPQFDGEHLSFEIKSLTGEAPKEFKSATLFIDPVNQNGMWTGT